MISMKNNAFVIDGNWCYGCHACELACQMERQFPSVDQMGIQVAKLGVWDYEQDGEEKWQDTFFAIPTDQCNSCAGTLKEGQQPVCATVCGAQALKLGDYDELIKEADTRRQMVVRIA